MHKLLLLLFVSLAAAQTTPNIGLTLPSPGTQPCGGIVDNNFRLIDSYMAGLGKLAGSNTWTGLQNFPSVGFFNASNSAVFTLAQMNEYVTSSLNSCRPSVEWHTTQGTYATDAMSGCTSAPSNATDQANGVAGYAVQTGSTVQ